MCLLKFKLNLSLIYWGWRVQFYPATVTATKRPIYRTVTRTRFTYCYTAVMLTTCVQVFCMNSYRLLVTKQNKKTEMFLRWIGLEITTTTTFIEARIPKNCFQLEQMIHFPQKCSCPNCTLLLWDDLDDGERSQTSCVAVLLSSCCLFIYLFIAVFVW